jgi:hypothetical protein
MNGLKPNDVIELMQIINNSKVINDTATCLLLLNKLPYNAFCNFSPALKKSYKREKASNY